MVRSLVRETFLATVWDLYRALGKLLANNQAYIDILKQMLLPDDLTKQDFQLIAWDSFMVNVQKSVKRIIVLYLL